MNRERKPIEKQLDIRLDSAAAQLEARLTSDPATRTQVLQARMLASGLSDSNSRRRAEVRERLAAIGKPALPALLAALIDPDSRVRWQAAKALSDLHDPETAVDLVNAMEDDDFGVRWLAAEGLTAMGVKSLEAVLLGLLRCFGSVRLREGAHHVLHVLVDDGLHAEAYERLLRALEGMGSAEEIAWLAEKAWEEWTGGKPPAHSGPADSKRNS